MAAYITGQDIADAYGQLFLNKISTPNGTAQSDPNIIKRAIDSAQSIVDAYIGNRYSIPLAIVSPVLVEAAIDIAVYKMCLSVTKLTPEISLRYNDAIKLLMGIGNGQVGIGLSKSDLDTNGDGGVTRQSLGRSIRTYRT